jgi:hypothetical protein
MVRMQARAGCHYSGDRAEGEIFEATPEDALVLERLGRADRVGEPPPAPRPAAPAEPPRGRLRRTDLRSEP